jgi:hypothetical protein
MKMIMIKKNIMKKVVVSTLICSLAFSVYASDDDAYIKSTNIAARFVQNINEQFVGLVSTNIKAPLNTFLVNIKQLLDDLSNQGNAIKRSNDEINILLHDLFEYVLIRFNIAYDVLKKYNGKPDKWAELSVEMKREFNTEEIFSEILRRLRGIKVVAQQKGNSALIKKLDTIIVMVEKKRKEWNAKSQASLLGGLTYRLGCK